ncbi:unnamed protein product [Orchesella dallaii]|uniref:Protein tipE n=1 Tax=Orchesella dallaii TaxID=48710 RepID=A0ABP1RUJ7_9HEXA
MPSRYHFAHGMHCIAVMEPFIVLLGIRFCFCVVALNFLVSSPTSHDDEKAFARPGMYKFSSHENGFSENTVMCTTVLNKTVENCEESPGVGTWSSCGEWCLSKSSGTCTQIYVDVRRNGSNIRLEKCDPSAFDTKYCHGIDPKMKVYECIKGDCSDLHGIFNCTLGPASPTGEIQSAACKNLTSVLSCNLTTTDLPIMCNNRQACHKLEGLYECTHGNCAKVRPPFKCEKRCISINTENKDIMIRQGDVIYTAKCERAVDMESELEIWPKSLKSLSKPDRPPMLMMFCTTLLEVPQDATTYTLSDCFNGTLLEPDHFGNFTNITYIVQSHHDSLERPLDPVERKFAPPEPDLLIYNNTNLYINHEACVNTLILQECEKFHAEYGGDGKDLRSQSRFQCYYSPNNTDFVVLRFSRIKTVIELIIAAAVPTTLAIVSCFTLVLCTRIIHVGDDSHFYFQCCGADAKAALEKEAVEAMAL